MQNGIVFFDLEVGLDSQRVLDAGACRQDGGKIHTRQAPMFLQFLAGSKYICGHNIWDHDLRYLEKWLGHRIILKPIDTLLFSPLLFPKRPYHRLLKDDKLQSDELNNPLNDSAKAMELFFEEVSAFHGLPIELKRIYCTLLYDRPEYRSFFEYVGFVPYNDPVSQLIHTAFQGKICGNADLDGLVELCPVELAYALSLIQTGDPRSIYPSWLLMKYPHVDKVLRYLLATPCEAGCEYCRNTFDIHKSLKRWFGYDSFRKYNDEPLQENAVKAAVGGKSILAIFPTGGGKSLTFQLPALMAGETVRGLTVVISPLQSLMKDQVDGLEKRGIAEAATINGLLNPVERKEAIDRVLDGTASILYISPESLRSKTVEKMLMSRTISRFVVDEAHCFSAWGQDFRVDYLYIGPFIRQLQEKKKSSKAIPVSCFTATAKQKVITDICDYFGEHLGVELKLFTSDAARQNLHYHVQFMESENEKFATLWKLLEAHDCPAIVYVSKTRKTEKLAERLRSKGVSALPFHGQMDSTDKVATQESFMTGDTRVIVATTAFGMGVDKSNVGLVVHYDISNSLENYVQEAGRAGRDETIQADCFVLYNNEDLDTHFSLLNRRKLSISEIQQVWKAIKDLTRQHATICCSPLEIIRQAGWEEGRDAETRVKSAIAALETAGYVERGQNVPRVYANSIQVRTMAEASGRLAGSHLLAAPEDALLARRVLSFLMGSRSRSKARDDSAESRVDYIADRLGVEKWNIVRIINLLRQEGLLADDNDMTAYILPGETKHRAELMLSRYINLERFLLDEITEDGVWLNIKKTNESAMTKGLAGASERNIKTVLNYLLIKRYIERSDEKSSDQRGYRLVAKREQLLLKLARREDICRFIIDRFFREAVRQGDERGEIPVQFSVVALLRGYEAVETGNLGLSGLTIQDIEDALLYLSKAGILKLEGGFLVLYSGMEIRRLIKDNAIRYKKDDYRSLDEFYKQKIQQIHIVGRYADLMMSDYEAALGFVHDYFSMDYQKFLLKYFAAEERKEISRNITPEKYQKLFGDLSAVQRSIIDDDSSRFIVVAAGPGSGKTKVLAHKLASLMLMEDVKSEQLLMLTFSRAAATEFKKRLADLVGNAARYVGIKTFHSYCFDLMGRPGNLDDSAQVVKTAVDMIRRGEVEPIKITKKVLVLDEAQDINEEEFALIEELIRYNDDLRIIAVGDDDQNIYEWRGSSSKYLYTLLKEYGAKKYEMVQNYRSRWNLVSFADRYAHTLEARMKTCAAEAVRRETGEIELVKHSGQFFEQAIVEDIRKRDPGAEQIAVLTATNDEAFRMLGCLKQAGVSASLIQSADQIRLCNIVEIRALLQYLDIDNLSPVIDQETWDGAKNRLSAAYAESINLPLCLKMMETFESTNAVYYRSDFIDFVMESKAEEFYEAQKGRVTISTIHKAKGREFDRVYLLLNNFIDRDDEKRHVLYVGMTRAKNHLHIHYNGNLFENMDTSLTKRRVDRSNYPVPNELMVQLSYKDIYLDSFIPQRERIYQLRSGCLVSLGNNEIFVEFDGQRSRIGRLSQKGINLLQDQQKNGYFPQQAIMRYIVEWARPADHCEYPVPLLDVRFRRGQNTR